jgi:O-succinylbenzoic acid--CoA ligase
MTRPLVVVDASDPAAVLEALRDALSGDGPAILPHQGRPADVPAEVPKRVALVIETSGSTGRPKRVALSADALLASAAASESALGGPGQWLLALPAHYIAGVNVLVRSLTSGTEPLLLPGGHFDPLALVELSDRMDAPLRFVSLVPAQLLRLLDAAEGATGDDDLVNGDATNSTANGGAAAGGAESALDEGTVRGAALTVLDRLRRFDRILLGGQAAPAALMERSLELGLNITRTYGSSETSGGCVYDGVPLAGVTARIAAGQIELGGVTLADGYLDDEERTAAAFVDDSGVRWYRTGDAGELVDGVVRVTGRLDSIIISGGVKVSLGEVERVVAGLPGLADAVVVPAPSVQWGEVPVVVTTASVPLETVRAAVAAELGTPARPVAVITVPQLPLLSSGKPDRLALRALAADAGSSEAGGTNGAGA